MPQTPDRDEERALDIVGASRLVVAVERTIVTVEAAWLDSAVRRITIRFAGAAFGAGLAGGVITVASATALVLQRLAARPTGPTWIVPAASLLAGLFLLGLARVRSEQEL